MRWLTPPPAATAAFSSARRPGVVLRVSRMRAPLPATASTKRAVSVATPERWPRKLRPTRSAASSARAGPLATSTSAGTCSRHCPSTTRLSTCSTPPRPPAAGVVGGRAPARPHRLGDDGGAGGPPRLFLHDPRPRPRLGRHGRLGGDVAAAEVLGEGAADQLGEGLVGLGHARQP